MVDLAWHQAILNTRLYREMCQSVFGYFLEHTTTTSSDPLHLKNGRIDITEAIYGHIFGEGPPGELWKREERLEERRLQDRKEEQIRSESCTILVRTLNGKTLSVPTDLNFTVHQLKKQIHEVEGVPPDQQRTIFAGIQLEDEQTLKEYRIKDKSLVHLIVRLKGC
jgi:hypothetical protein